MFWCDALHYNHADIARLPSFDAKKLVRKAFNFFLLGLSLPSVLDMSTSNPVDYLRSLNALLLEFDSYQQIHPPDGSSLSSLSRARIPQMFKRSNTGKTRRTSSAADIGLPRSTSDPIEINAMAGNAGSASANMVSFASSEQELLPGEEYTYLLTPSLPFDPDFYEVFATLCEVLIECYVRVTNMIAAPSDCVPGLAEIFAKADAKVRKVIVAPIVSEFQDATRASVKAEVSGITKIVLGGLM